MPNVKFNLKDAASKDDTLVYLIFRYNGKRLKYSTSQKISPKYWNFDKKRPRAKETRKFPQYPEFNAFLDKLENITQTTYRRYLNEGRVPALEELKKALDIVTHRSEDSAPRALFPFIEQFIEERGKSPNYSGSSIKVYGTVFNQLKNYSTNKRIRLDFENIDLEFFYGFTEYLFAAPRMYSNNYVNKIIQTLKTFLNDATERGINKNMAYKSRRFNVPKEAVQNIYLSLEELNQLYHYDFSEQPRLERVRDLFIVGCFTGLRFSDFSNIKPEQIRQIDSVEVIDLVTQKTKQPVVIPLHPYVRAVLNKYGGQPPKALSNQKMNDYLKDMGEAIGFDEPIILTKSKGGQRYDIKQPKYKLISTHTARRSFASNAFKAGVPTLSIMRITGHKTETSFMQYIKLTNEENAVLMASNRFFKEAQIISIAK